MNIELGYKGELVSYRTLRRVVGVLGISLPLILAVWGLALCGCLQPSISDYYSLRTRDVLVGVLFTIAWFLFAYRGYEREDDIAGDLACLFALGIALFHNSGAMAEEIIHYSCTAGFFLVLAYFSYFLFTKSAGSPTPQKLIRNAIYRTCGIGIVACIVFIGLIGLYRHFWDVTAISRLQPVFWLESLALWFFGWSWFVKGETLFKDPS